MNQKLLMVLLIILSMPYLIEGVWSLLMVLLNILSMRFLKKRAWILWPWKIFMWKSSMWFIHVISLRHTEVSVMKS